MNYGPGPLDFPPVDHSTWLEKVKVELKGKPLSDFDYTWDGIQISPFDVPPSKPGKISDRKDNSWKIGSYSFCSGPQANAHLMNALNEGASSIFMEINQIPDWLSLFKKVHLEWIHLNLKFTQRKDLSSFIQYLQDTGQKASGSISVNNFDPYKLFTELYQALPGYRFINYELRELDNRNPLANIFHQLTRGIELLSKKYDHLQVLNQVVIHISGQNDLMLNISMIRAIRLLWKQLLKSAGIETNEAEIYIIAHVPHHTFHDAYIRSGLITISMILGGIDELFIESPDTNGKNSRYCRMIQHILDLEANLSKVVDPLAGSHVMEYLTGLIVQRVWNETILMDKQKK